MSVYLRALPQKKIVEQDMLDKVIAPRRDACMSLLGLSRLWRAKRSHAAVTQALAQGGELNWAQHLSAQAYADQSHMVK